MYKPEISVAKDEMLVAFIGDHISCKFEPWTNILLVRQVLCYFNLFP